MDSVKFERTGGRLGRCNGCVSMVHLAGDEYRCCIFTKSRMRGHINPEDPCEEMIVIQPKPCPFWSKGGNDYE